MGDGRLRGVGRAAGYARQAVEGGQSCQFSLVVFVLAFATVASPAVMRLLRRHSPGSAGQSHERDPSTNSCFERARLQPCRKKALENPGLQPLREGPGSEKHPSAAKAEAF